MRISLINFSYLPNIGGHETLIRNVARRLVQRGHEVTVVTSNTVKLKPAKLKSEEYIEGVKVKRFKSYQILPYRHLLFTPGIIPYILSMDVDIVHCFAYLPTFMTNVAPLVVKLKRVPLVWTPDFYPGRSMIYSGFLQKTLMPLYDRLGLVLLRRADAIIPFTDIEAEFHKANGNKNSFAMLCGVSLDSEYQVTEADMEEVARKFDIVGDKIILSVGRMVWYKGFDLLVRAYAKTQQRFHNSKLILVGPDGGYRTVIEKTARDLGCENGVIFTGEISDNDLNCLYEIADVIVRPSLYEGFGLTTLEAWLHKKPVVGFEKVGEPIPSSAGISVRYQDSDALSDAVVELLSDEALCSSLGEQGFKLVEEKYEWNKVVDRLEDIYRRVVAT